ncbi:CBS domain-containing protein [Kribbella sp. NPDC003505]|uniref:CBS domain-containing protein n=1 Tax=Kribbella sp. NPDC003505 TaxID=3154448 RepID=UPI0033B9E690
MRVRDVMTTPATTVTAETSIGAASRLMGDEQLTSIVVVDDSRALVGTVELSDLRTHETEQGADRDAAPTHRVGEVQVRRTACVRCDDEIAVPIDLIRSTTAALLPVVDNDRVVGTLSRDDLLDLLADREVRADLLAGSACGSAYRR